MQITGHLAHPISSPPEVGAARNAKLILEPRLCRRFQAQWILHAGPRVRGLTEYFILLNELL